MERRLLQICISVAALVPVAGGISGVIYGGDSQFRYLSGVLAAIGIAYWTTVPDIEREGDRFALLTLLVVAGGFCRAVGMLIAGPPGLAMTAALIMELVVTPLLYLWQTRIARVAATAAVDAPRTAR
jgi:hypothetical protein